jgi:hypothetical protein
MSLASPIVLKMKKTPSRKITLDLRGTPRRNPAVLLIDSFLSNGRYYTKGGRNGWPGFVEGLQCCLRPGRGGQLCVEEQKNVERD